MNGVRRLMEDSYRKASSGAITVAVAPTSYGKTAASPCIWAEARRKNVAWSLIHVAPLRSLLWGVFQDFFQPHGGRLQMHGAEDEIKSPYFLSDLVATTLDSFLWNLYRVPVAEAMKIQRGGSMGHYYPALLAIYSSMIVMDEAHMYLWENPGVRDSKSIGVQAVLVALKVLARIGAPIIVETATVRPGLLKPLSELAMSAKRDLWVTVLEAPSNNKDCLYIKKLKDSIGPKGGYLESIKDKEWESSHLVPWKTEISPYSWEGVINEIADDASRGPVLVVANTVKEAVKVYKGLSSRVQRIALVHGRLNNNDRRAAEDEIRRIDARGGVVVATQVAEAGLDVNSLAVYTAGAPLESLVQRAGRACRRGKILDECREEGGRLVIVSGASRGPYRENEVMESLELIKKALDNGRIDWRAPCNHEDYTGYGELLARLPDASLYRDVRHQLLEQFLKSDATPSLLFDILNEVCGLARDTLMLEVAVGDSTVAVSLEWALSNASEVLEMGKGGAPILQVVSEGVREVEAVGLWRAWRSQSRKRVKCSMLIEKMLEDASKGVEKSSGGFQVRLKARSGAYKERLGLLLPGEDESP